MSNSNHITKVAVVGAGGNCGKFITEALLKTGKHTVTAITRADSQTKLPEGVASKEIDYSKPETLVEALKGQDALIITLSGYSPKETQDKLIHAAGEAGVPWILPNEWGPDTTHEGLLRDVVGWQSKLNIRKAIEDLSKSSHISVCTGYWYEWSLSLPPAFGFDFANRTLTLYDEGETKISISTWPQVGRAVAALLSLPIMPNGSNKEACLDSLRNQVVYVNSFTVSQRDILESALRVTRTKEEDWTITREPTHERYASAVKQMEAGKRDEGFIRTIYSRVFFPDGAGDFEHSKGTLNRLLGLPKEDMDEATEKSFERSKGST